MDKHYYEFISTSNKADELLADNFTEQYLTGRLKQPSYGRGIRGNKINSPSKKGAMETSRMSILKKASLLILFSLLTACGFGSNGLDELKRLCEKDAGLTIYKTVEADGYYDTTGSNADLIHSDYQFFEYCDDTPTIVDLVPEPGCWRVRKVNRSSGQCYKPLDKKLAKFIVEPYPEFLKQNCIAVEKIDKPTARYSYHSDLKSWPAANGVSEFIRSYALFKDEQSGEILSKYVSYSYNKTPRHTSPISCHSLDDKYSVSIKKGFVEKTIVPNKGEKK